MESWKPKSETVQTYIVFNKIAIIIIFLLIYCLQHVALCIMRIQTDYIGTLHLKIINSPWSDIKIKNIHVYYRLITHSTFAVWNVTFFMLTSTSALNHACNIINVHISLYDNRQNGLFLFISFIYILSLFIFFAFEFLLHYNLQTCKIFLNHILRLALLTHSISTGIIYPPLHALGK